MRLPDVRRVAYAYDALGRRVHKRAERDDGAVMREVRFVWDGNALALELDSERGRRSFAHRPGSLEPLLQEERGEGFAYVTDQVGVPRELVDGAGRVAWAGAFTAFGKLVEAEQGAGRGWRVESPFRLQGQVYDEESGLSWTRFRCFDAEAGRWLSADPLGLAGGAEIFGFDGSPNQARDPLGLTTGGNPHYTVSDKRRRHILEGDPQGTGHGPKRGQPNSFPDTWNDDQAVAAVERVVNSPSSTWKQVTGPGVATAAISKGGPAPGGPAMTSTGNPVRYRVRGRDHGKDIDAIVEPGGEGIITGYPTN